MMCINDGIKPENFETEKQNLINAFEQILPEKSSFEKQNVQKYQRKINCKKQIKIKDQYIQIF